MFLCQSKLTCICTDGSCAFRIRTVQHGFKKVTLTLFTLYGCDCLFTTRLTLPFLNLFLLVPPQKIVITDDRGTELKGVAGPFNENGILLLSCEAVGGGFLESRWLRLKPQHDKLITGLPPPKVTWWKNNRLVDSTSESYRPGRVRNTLRLANLGRADYGTNLTCQASNNNVSFPVSNDITIDMRRNNIKSKFPSIIVFPLLSQ